MARLSVPLARPDGDPTAAAALVEPSDAQAEVLSALCDRIDRLERSVLRYQHEVLRRIDELVQAGLAASRALAAESIAWPGPRTPGDPSIPTADGDAATAPVPDTAAAVTAGAATGRPTTVDTLKAAAYERLVTHVRALVRTLVPADAVVAVASRGDESLVDLDARTGWHFPRSEDGRWAGHYPRDGRDAVVHLEDLRRAGLQYLVFPTTALWWLDHYPELRRHLETHARLVIRRDDACVIYALDPR
jgi:hypothetical protein